MMITQQVDGVQVFLDHLLASDRSFDDKIKALRQTEETIKALYEISATNVKPVFLMNEDDLVH